jgi:DNA ligase (NAD+)
MMQETAGSNILTTTSRQFLNSGTKALVIPSREYIQSVAPLQIQSLRFYRKGRKIEFPTSLEATVVDSEQDTKTVSPHNFFMAPRKKEEILQYISRMNAERDCRNVVRVGDLLSDADRIEDIDRIPESLDETTLTLWKNRLKKLREQFKDGNHKITSYECDLLEAKTNALGLALGKPEVVDNLTEVVGYTEEELSNFFTSMDLRLGKLPERSFYLSPVINGVEFEVRYNNGLLLDAYAINLGKTDKLDVTQFIRAIDGVPRFIRYKDPVTVRGTLSISKKNLFALNVVRREFGLREYLDPKQALASALLCSENSTEFLDQRVRCFFHSYTMNGKTPSALTNLHEFEPELTKLGFSTLSRNSSQIVVLNKPYEKNRLVQSLTELQKLEFYTDGASIKVDGLKEFVLSKNATFIFVLKPEIVLGKVDQVDFRILKNGRMFSTVSVQFPDKSVKQFIFNNESHYREMLLGVADTVAVMKHENTDDKIIKSYRDGGQDIRKFPNNCPKCSAPLVVALTENNDRTYRCSSHLVCQDLNIEEVLHLASACAFNIPLLNRTVIKELVDKHILISPLDIFKLTRHELEMLDSISKESISTLLSEINTAKKVSLSRFIFALNIPNVTYLMAEEIANVFGSIAKLMKITKADLKGLEYVDSVAIASIAGFFYNPSSKSKITQLIDTGVIVSEPTSKIGELWYKRTEEYTQEEYNRIIDIIQEANMNYMLSDLEFDVMERAASKIEALHPDWTKSREQDLSVREIVPMKDGIHLKKTYSKGALKDFLRKTKWNTFVVEPKINGVACALKYSNGKLIQATTKHGNGSSGTDITDFVLQVNNIPKSLMRKFSGIVRGELFLPEQMFQRICHERQRSGLGSYVDSLGAIVGAIRKKEKNLSMLSQIHFFGFHIVLEENANEKSLIKPQNVSDIHTFLSRLGFCSTIKKPYQLFNNLNAAVNYASDIESRRAETETSIDGVVVRPLAVHKEQKITGYALKFDQEVRTTKILGVSFNASKNGIIMSTLELDPIKFSNGRTVSRVYVQSLERIVGLYENDTVKIKYSGGVMPVLASICAEKRLSKAVPVALPTECPSCNDVLSTRKDIGLQCVNTLCSGKKVVDKLFSNYTYFLRNTRYSFTQKMSNSESKQIISDLVRNGLIKDLKDFYMLLPEDLVGNTSLSHDEAQVLIAGIQKSKETTKENALSLIFTSILSEQLCVLLAKKIDDISVLPKLSKEQLKKLGIHQNAAEKIINYFQDQRAKESFIFLMKNVFDIKEEASIKDTLDVLQKVEKEFTSRYESYYRIVKSAQEALEAFKIANEEAIVQLQDTLQVSEKTVEIKPLLYRLRHTQLRNNVLGDSLNKYLSKELVAIERQSSIYERETTDSDDWVDTDIWE